MKEYLNLLNINKKKNIITAIIKFKFALFQTFQRNPQRFMNYMNFYQILFNYFCNFFLYSDRFNPVFFSINSNFNKVILFLSK